MSSELVHRLIGWNSIWKRRSFFTHFYLGTHHLISGAGGGGGLEKYETNLSPQKSAKKSLLEMWPVVVIDEKYVDQKKHEMVTYTVRKAYDKKSYFISSSKQYEQIIGRSLRSSTMGQHCVYVSCLLRNADHVHSPFFTFLFLICLANPTGIHFDVKCKRCTWVDTILLILPGLYSNKTHYGALPRLFNTYNAEIFLYKPWRPKGLKSSKIF